MASKITVNRGTTYEIGVTYKVNGVATDITGSTLLFTVKNAEYDSDTADSSALISKDVTSHTDPTNGVSTIVLNPSDTRALAPGTYFYSVKIDVLSDDSKVYELDEGKFKIDADPTNRTT